jgi:hypothetical protein
MSEYTNYLVKSRYFIHFNKKRLDDLIKSNPIYSELKNSLWISFTHLDQDHLLIMLNTRFINDPWWEADTGCLVNDLLSKLIRPNKPGRKPDLYLDKAFEQIQNGMSPIKAEREWIKCKGNEILLMPDPHDTFTQGIKRRKKMGN